MDNRAENREVAIQLSGVKKRYKLGQIGGGTLQGDLQSWWARVRGKEDPNTKIGTDQRLVGQTFMALNGIDLTVYKGEALGIIGGNGAGKSTMLKLLSRVTAPTEGEIDIYGRIASMLEVGTGFNGEMTGRENVYLNGAILGMTKAEIDAKMEQIIEFSEVREFIDTPAAWGCSMLALPGHKGLLGPHGTGALWVSADVRLAPMRQGGTGSVSESMFQPRMMPDALESGTLNLPGIAGLRAGLRVALSNREEAHENAVGLCAQMREALLGIPGVRVYTPEGASLLSFNIEGIASQEAASALDEAGIAVRGGLHCAPGVHRFLGTLETGAVRVSPGISNTREDARQLVAAVARLARSADQKGPPLGGRRSLAKGFPLPEGERKHSEKAFNHSLKEESINRNLLMASDGQMAPLKPATSWST